METHSINVSFGSNQYATVKAREQYSYGQEIVFSNIELPEVFEAYFSNSPTGEAKSSVGKNNKVLIPDEYFLSGETIYCYIFVHDTSTDGRMQYVVKIPIVQRPEPTDLELTDIQQDIVADAVATLQESTARVTDIAEQVNENLVTSNQNVEQSSLNADKAEEFAKLAGDFASTSEEKASLANEYMDDTKQFKQTVEGIADEFASDVANAREEINSKNIEAKEYAKNAKFYSDLAERTVSKWMDDENDETVVMPVDGMNPKINATTNTIYICGELLSLDFTPCQNGICDIIFSSGSTPTLLTMPDTVKMPNGFAVLENRTYEINILNGVYGVATSWV